MAADVERLSESLGQFPEAVARLAFSVVSGLPGARKSYFCSHLAGRLPFIILESDALPEVPFPLPSYSSKESRRPFQAVLLLVEGLVKKEVSVILGTANLSERHREYLYSIADRLNVKLIRCVLGHHSGAGKIRIQESLS